MKKILVAILAVVAVMSSGAQERVNKQQNDFIESSDILTSAIGWEYNETIGEWIDYDKCICYDKSYKDKYKILCNSSYQKSNYSNFESIQVKSMLYEDSIYYVIIVKKWDGSYKYPAIQEDWMEYKVTDYYVVTKQQYDQLFNISNNILIIKGYKTTKSRYNDTPENIFVDNMIKDYKKYSTDTYLNKSEPVLILYKSTDNNIRFRFNDGKSFIFTKIKMSYIRGDNWKLTFDNFDGYFEISENNFNKIILNRPNIK